MGISQRDCKHTSQQTPKPTDQVNTSMGKSPDRNVAIEGEFSKLELLLKQTADDTSISMKLLKKQLSEYDSRNGNHFTNTATSFMRSDMRNLKDVASDLRHVAHDISGNRKQTKTEIASARNMMNATAKAMESLKISARNYDRENKQTKGIKGTIDATFGSNHDKRDEKHEGLLGNDREKEPAGFGRTVVPDEKQHGVFGTNQNSQHHHGGVLGGEDRNGGGIIGSAETVETLVLKILRDNFSLNALDHQITAAEKTLSPSIVERAKEKIHDVKDKLKGEKSSESHVHGGHHSNQMVTP